MTLTVMKVFYKKRKSNLINYRSYKNFDNSTFMNDVKKNLTSNAPENFARNFDLFKHVVFDTFEKHAPLKKRSVRANQGPFMNKKISKYHDYHYEKITPEKQFYEITKRNRQDRVQYAT